MISIEQFKNQFQLALTLNFNNRWENLDSILFLIKEFIIISYENKNRAESIAVAILELCENCIKYATNPNDKDKPNKLFLILEESSVHFETQNYSKIENIEILENEIDRINDSSKTKEEIYVEKMKEASKNTFSRLGLIRVIIDADGKITTISNNNFIKVIVDFYL